MAVKLQVWNGLSTTRPDLSSVKNPDHTDYLQIVCEVQKLQQEFLNLVQNLKMIPNLQSEFDSALKSIVDLRNQIQILTPPADLVAKLENLDAKIVAQDTRKTSLILTREVESLRIQLDKNQLQVLQLQEAFATQVTAFQHQMWNALKNLELDVKERLDATEKKIESVAIQTRIQSLLEELNKNETRH